MLTAALMFTTTQYTFGDGAVGLAALKTANAKASLAFVPAVTLGIMCNALVCLGVWMCYSARTTVGKIFAIVPPVSAFVAAGFEHSIANIYFIPMALFIKAGAAEPFWTFDRQDGSRFSGLDVGELPVGQPSSGHRWQYHRGRGNGRCDLLVCLSAKEQARRPTHADVESSIAQVEANLGNRPIRRLNSWIGSVAPSDRPYLHSYNRAKDCALLSFVLSNR